MINQYQFTTTELRDLMMDCSVMGVEKEEKGENVLIAIEFRKQGRENDNNLAKPWNHEEIYRAAAFFYHNSDKFQSEATRKRWKIFKYMSLFVQSKNVNQCRSYSKKLMRTFKTIEKINSFFQHSLALCPKSLEELRGRNQMVFRQMSISSGEQSNCKHTESANSSQKMIPLIPNVEKRRSAVVKEFPPVSPMDGLYQYCVAEEQQALYFNAWFHSHNLFLQWLVQVQKAGDFQLLV